MSVSHWSCFLLASASFWSTAPYMFCAQRSLFAEQWNYKSLILLFPKAPIFQSKSTDILLEVNDIIKPEASQNLVAQNASSEFLWNKQDECDLLVEKLFKFLAFLSLNMYHGWRQYSLSYITSAMLAHISNLDTRNFTVLSQDICCFSRSTLVWITYFDICIWCLKHSVTIKA